MPGLSGGIAMDPSSNTAYVSGIAESDDSELEVPDSVPGQQGDVIHVLKFDPTTGQATRNGVIRVPPPSAAPPYQDFPPNSREALLAARPGDQPRREDPARGAQPRRPRGGDQHLDAGRSLRRGRPLPLRRRDHPQGQGTRDQRDPGHGLGDRPRLRVRREEDPGGPAPFAPRRDGDRSETPRAYVALASEDQIAVIDTAGWRSGERSRLPARRGTGRPRSTSPSRRTAAT